MGFGSDNTVISLVTVRKIGLCTFIVNSFDRN